MNKTILLIAIMSMVTLGTVHGDFREVTCGFGSIGGMCHETELQDEFNEVVDLIDDLEDAQLATDDEISDLWQQLDNIQDETQRQRWVDRMHDFKLFVHDMKIHRLETRMTAQESKVDRVGGGINTGELGALLFGDKWFFRQAVSFIDKLKEIFATHEDLEAVRAECNHPGASQWDLDNYAALYKADRTGEPVYLDGRVCRPGADRCILI